MKIRRREGTKGRCVALLLAALVEPCARAEPPNYEEHIAPILRESCVGCHRGSRAQNGLVLDSMQGILEGGSGGAAIEPGDAAGSFLYQTIARTREPFMPFEEAPMDPAKVELIRAWIDGGALETAGGEPLAKPKPTVAMTIDPSSIGRPSGAPAMPGEMRIEPFWWSESGTAVLALTTSPWSPLVAVGGHRQVSLHHAETLETLGVLPFDEGHVQTLRFSRDGAVLIAGGGTGASSGRVVAWDVTSGERVLEIGDEPDVVMACDLSVDRIQVALGGPDGIVRVFDARDGTQQYEIEEHTDWITALAFSPDGVLLATGDRAGNVHVWEAGTGREFHTLPAHQGRVTGIGWRGDSMVVVTAGDDGQVRLLEMEQGRQVAAFSSHGGVLALHVMPDGRSVTAGRDGVTRLWNASGAAEREFASAGDLATACAATHDGARVVVGDWRGGVRVFGAADGALLGTLAPNPAPVARRAVDLAASKHAALVAAQPALDERANNAASAVEPAATALEQATAAAQAAQTALEQAAAEASGANDRAIAARQIVSEAAAPLDATRTRLGEITARRAEAEVHAATTHAEMLDAIAAAATAEGEASATADRLVEGATALAQRAAEAVAAVVVEQARAEAEIAHLDAAAAPKLAEATTLEQRAMELASVVTAAQGQLDESLRTLQTAHATHDTAVAELESARSAAASNRDAAAAAERAARDADATWAQRRVEIASRGGRVDS